MEDIRRLLSETQTESGESLLALSEASPLLMVFLRHFGCTFCREAVSDIVKRREYLQKRKVRPVFIHMSSEAEAEEFFKSHGAATIDRVSDPDRNLYRAFDLERGSLVQLLAPRVWIRGFWTALVKGHGFGGLKGDAFQMPGVFLVSEGKILRDFRAPTPADHPHYESMADSAQTP